MILDHDGTSPSIAKVSAPSAARTFHARGAATEKALSLIRRRVRGTMRLPHDEEAEERSVDRPRILATDVRSVSVLYLFGHGLRAVND